MSSFDSLFGQTLKSQSADVDTNNALAGKTVAVYFSAHWCPPCRGFTPKLAEFYNKHKQTKNLEVVFVSGDNDLDQFEEYYKEMPWLAVSYGSEHIDKLNSKFEVEGIPTLVILDSQGELITKKGREEVMADPNAESFPWIPKTYAEIIPGPLIKSHKDKNDTIEYSELKGKLIGIYFSAHWCPPCRAFTPMLAEFYTKQKQNKNFEIIFSSRDKDEKSYQEYYEEMPWLSLPFKEKRNNELANFFELNGIPYLVFVDHDGKVVCSDATSRLRDDPEGKEFPWPIKPVYRFTDSIFVRHISSGPVLFVKSSEEEAEELIGKLSDVVNALPEDKKVHIFVYTDANKESPSLERIFQFSGVEEGKKADLILLNIRNGSKYLSTEEANFDAVKKVVNDFSSGNLEMSSFS